MSENTQLEGLLASCVAGFASRVICHPIDTLKARLQAAQGSMPSGAGGLYRGLTAALIGGVPATCLYLTSYELSKKTLSSTPVIQDSPFAVYFVSGILAEGVSCSVFVPTDVIKERLQVQGSASPYKYKGSFDALRQIMSQEGLRGLYKGYGASILSFGPFSALYFVFYEGLKKKLHTQHGGSFLDNLYRLVHQQNYNSRISVLSDKENLSPLIYPPHFSPLGVSAALAGAAASYLTNPLDLAKLRLQVLRAGPSATAASASSAAPLPTTTAGMLALVVRLEGFRGLFRGAVARVLFHTPNTALTMVAFEQTKLWLASRTR